MVGQLLFEALVERHLIVCDSDFRHHAGQFCLEFFHLGRVFRLRDPASRSGCSVLWSATGRCDATPSE